MKKMEKQNKVEDYFSTKRTTFFALLRSTKKWKEIYNQTESKISFILSIVIVAALCVVYHHSNFDKYMDLLDTITMFALESSVGMLGFIISGLAIFTGTITNRLVKNINSDEKIDALIGVLFSFYFIGMIIGINVIIYIVVYIFLVSDFVFTLYRLIIVGGICLYLYIFAIFYSVSLLGTCIRLFFVSYKYSKSDDDKIEE